MPDVNVSSDEFSHHWYRDLLFTYLSPHLGGNDADILMSDFDRSGDQLGVDYVFTEQDERVSGPGDMFRMLLLGFSILNPALGGFHIATLTFLA